MIRWSTRRSLESVVGRPPQTERQNTSLFLTGSGHKVNLAYFKIAFFLRVSVKLRNVDVLFLCFCSIFFVFYRILALYSPSYYISF